MSTVARTADEVKGTLAASKDEMRRLEHESKDLVREKLRLEDRIASIREVGVLRL
jgi:hypothetical protein